MSTSASPSETLLGVAPMVCDNVVINVEDTNQPNQNLLNGSQPSGIQPNGSEPNANQPNGNQPNETQPANQPNTATQPPNGSQPLLKKQKALTSIVWKEFERVNRNNSWFAICKHCRQSLNGATCNGTTHLRKHLERCMRKSCKDISQQLIAFKEKKKDGTVELENFKFDPDRSREDLARMIILHEYPFTMVKHVGFRMFVKNLQPMFKFLSGPTVKADCMKIYEHEKVKVYQKLDNFHGRISVTSDLWTSCQNFGYMSLTAHYIDGDWKLQKKILNFLKVDIPHNAERISETTMACFMEWNIDNKLMAFTLDNCKLNDSVLRKISSMLKERDGLICDGEFFHVRCAAHILNLIVKDGLKAIEDVLEKIRESVKFVRGSPKRIHIFNDVAQQVHITCPKSLVLDCTTRWNSTFLMLEVALEYKNAFSRLKNRDRDYKDAPSNEEWERASEVAKCLKHFYETTNVFSGVKYPTSNLYFLEICEIHIQLIEWCNSSSTFICTMAQAMKEKFDKYWSTCHLVLAVAAVLDPQFKMKLVEYYYSEIYGNNASFYINSIYQGFVSLYQEYATCLPSNSMDNSSQVGSSVEGGGNCSSGGGNSKLKRYLRYLNETSGNQTMKNDLDYYLEEPVFPQNSDFNILDWWKVHEGKYPILSKMARDILAIPVSTVASEAAFSTGGRVVDSYRNSLNPETVQALICTQDWLKDEIKEYGASVEDDDYNL